MCCASRGRGGTEVLLDVDGLFVDRSLEVDLVRTEVQRRVLVVAVEGDAARQVLELPRECEVEVDLPLVSRDPLNRKVLPGPLLQTLHLDGAAVAVLCGHNDRDDCGFQFTDDALAVPAVLEDEQAVAGSLAEGALERLVLLATPASDLVRVVAVVVGHGTSPSAGRGLNRISLGASVILTT